MPNRREPVPMIDILGCQPINPWRGKRKNNLSKFCSNRFGLVAIFTWSGDFFHRNDVPLESRGHSSREHSVSKHPEPSRLVELHPRHRSSKTRVRPFCETYHWWNNAKTIEHFCIKIRSNLIFFISRHLNYQSIFIHFCLFQNQIVWEKSDASYLFPRFTIIIISEMVELLIEPLIWW